jgi:D-alanyl-D-alanine carboxypeptidase
VTAEQLAAAAELIARAADDLGRWQPVPGGVVVVCDRDRRLLTIPFGRADLARDVPVTEQHLFEIGSISKAMTSVLINQLVDAGRMRLDDRLVDHLPWVDVGPHTRQITIEQLLNHTAGLATGGDALPDDVAQAWALRQRCATEPGRHFHYSNAGYLLLGLVVRAVAGMPHWTMLERRVFDPLAMSGSLSRIRHRDRDRLAIGYRAAFDDRPWLPGDPLAPATWFEVAAADGNVALDAAGLGQFLRLLLGDGSVDGARIVSAAAMERMATVRAPGGEDVPPRHDGYPVADSRYGLGLNVETVAGRRCLTHGGGMVGYSSFVLADLDAGLAVGTLTNADGDCLAAHLLARYAHRLVSSALSGEALNPLPSLDPVVTAEDVPKLRDLRGTGNLGDEVWLDVVAEEGRALVRAGGVSGVLFRDSYGRLATDHPEFRLNHLHRAGKGLATDHFRAYVGHYRSHSPWFSNFRIVQRAGRLFLIAPGGVEAPTADEELVPVSDATFRIGDDTWRPERLTRVATVEGQVVVLDRDGCAYSRTFTP